MIKKYIIVDEKHPNYGCVFDGKHIDNPNTMVDLFINEYQCMTLLKEQVQEVDGKIK